MNEKTDRQTDRDRQICTTHGDKRAAGLYLNALGGVWGGDQAGSFSHVEGHVSHSLCMLGTGIQETSSHHVCISYCLYLTEGERVGERERGWEGEREGGREGGREGERAGGREGELS